MKFKRVHCPLTRNSRIKVNKHCIIGWVELVTKFKTRNGLLPVCLENVLTVDSGARMFIVLRGKSNKKFHFKFDMVYDFQSEKRPNVNIMLSMISIKLNFHIVLG